MRLLLFVILSLNFLQGATIYGGIYNSENFEGVNGTIMKISGQRQMQFIVWESNYSVVLPRGEYVFQVYYYESGRLKYYTAENLTVGVDDAQFDLVLFSPDMWERADYNGMDIEIYEGKVKEQNSDYILYIILGIGVVVIGATVAFIVLKRGRNAKEKIIETEIDERKEKAAGIPVELDDDAKKVLELIASNEGRMLQREIREIVGFSETKMSLIVTELEALGLVKRIKKGRGNILKIIKRD